MATRAISRRALSRRGTSSRISELQATLFGQDSTIESSSDSTKPLVTHDKVFQADEVTDEPEIEQTDQDNKVDAAALLAKEREALGWRGKFFGVNLEKALAESKKNQSEIDLPVILEDCCTYIEGHARVLTKENLLTQKGIKVTDKLKQLIKSYETNGYAEIWTIRNPFIIVDLLQYYLKALPGPVIPTSEYEGILLAYMTHPTPKDRLPNYRMFLSKHVTGVYRTVLYRIMDLIQKIRLRFNQNKIEDDYLVDYFSPILISKTEKGMTNESDPNELIIHGIVRDFVIHWKRIANSPGVFAATKVQTLWRMRMAKKALSKRKKKAFEARYLAEVQERMKREREAAVTLTALAKGLFVRRYVYPMLKEEAEKEYRRKKYKHYLKAVDKIVRIQAVWRGAAYRVHTEKERLNSAARVIQRNFKQFTSRQMASVVLEALRRKRIQDKENLKIWGVTQVQAAYRGAKGREEVLRMKEMIFMNQKATDIQRIWRGCVPRPAFRKRLQKYRQGQRRKATIKIQSTGRMYLAMKKTRKLRQLHRLQQQAEELTGGFMTVCENDEENLAVVYCSDCRKHFCATCNMVLHRLQREHDRIPIAEQVAQQSAALKIKEEDTTNQVHSVEETGKGKSKILDLSNMGLIELPVGTSIQTWLEELNLEHNEFRYIGEDELGNLRKLRVLKLSFNGELYKLPDCVCDLVELRELYCSFTVIQTLPECIGKLEYLDVLQLDSNQIYLLPSSLGNLHLLRKFSASNNTIKEIPVEMRNCRNMRNFTVSHNEIGSLPREFCRLKYLQTLDLSSNELEDLPLEFGQLISLKEFKVAHNYLTELPPGLGSLTNLELLNVSHNKLSGVLSDDMSQCKTLQYVDLSFNSIRDLPPSIGLLDRLKSLNLQKNALITLPDEMSYCRSLEKLVVKGNTHLRVPQMIVDTNYPLAILAHLRHLELEDTWNDIGPVPKRFAQFLALDVAQFGGFSMDKTLQMEAGLGGRKVMVTTDDIPTKESKEEKPARYRLTRALTMPSMAKRPDFSEPISPKKPLIPARPRSSTGFRSKQEDGGFWESVATTLSSWFGDDEKKAGGKAKGPPKVKEGYI